MPPFRKVLHHEGSAPELIGSGALLCLLLGSGWGSFGMPESDDIRRPAPGGTQVLLGWQEALQGVAKDM